MRSSILLKLTHIQMESLDLTTGILHRQSSLNDAREHAATIVMGTGKMSFLYVFGGRGINSDLDSVEMWVCDEFIYMKSKK